MPVSGGTPAAAGDAPPRTPAMASLIKVPVFPSRHALVEPTDRAGVRRLDQRGDRMLPTLQPRLAPVVGRLVHVHLACAQRVPIACRCSRHSRRRLRPSRAVRRASGSRRHPGTAPASGARASARPALRAAAGASAVATRTNGYTVRSALPPGLGTTITSHARSVWRAGCRARPAGTARGLVQPGSPRSRAGRRCARSGGSLAGAANGTARRASRMPGVDRAVFFGAAGAAAVYAVVGTAVHR